MSTVHHSDEEKHIKSSVFLSNQLKNNIDEKVQFNDLTVTFLEVLHSANPRMMRFEVENKIIAYSGDTAFHEKSLREINGADLIIHEASTYDFSIPKHTTYKELSSFKFSENTKSKQTFNTKKRNKTQHEKK